VTYFDHTELLGFEGQKLLHQIVEDEKKNVAPTQKELERLEQIVQASRVKIERRKER
jgi:hypothetical protein